MLENTVQHFLFVFSLVRPLRQAILNFVFLKNIAVDDFLFDSFLFPFLSKARSAVKPRLSRSSARLLNQKLFVGIRCQALLLNNFLQDL